jgi:hypothetical protein
MKFDKKVIAKLNKCYSIAPLYYKGYQCLLVAAEKLGPCYLFDLNGNLLDTIWEGPGGVMTMVQVPDTDGQFLAVHEFYSPNDSANARIVVATPGENGWKISELVSLPFVHRFDVLRRNGISYLIACTIKSAHSHKDDWSSPGKVYTAVLPDDLSEFSSSNQLKLGVLMEGLYRNHGYCRLGGEEANSCLVTADQGVYRITPPDDRMGTWTVRQLTSEPTSDAVIVDLDMDGEQELFTFTPFHGETIRISKYVSGKYQQIYSNHGSTEFLHAICSGRIAGKNAVVVGHRKGNKGLYMYTYDHQSSSYEFQQIDSGGGPANAYIYHYNDEDRIIATNYESGEVVIYTLHP